MAITPVTSWTDFDMDWDNPNPGDSRYSEALLRAYDERLRAVNSGSLYGYSGLSLADNFLLSYPVGSNLSLRPEHVNRSVYFTRPDGLVLLEYLLPLLLTRFVNHTDSDGDWEGETTIPNWNINTILRDAGLGDRVSLQLSGSYPYNISHQWPVWAKSDHMVKWFKQMYAILNRMRWYQHMWNGATYWGPHLQSKPGAYTSGASRLAAYSAAAAQWDADEWGAYAWASPRQMAYASESGGNYTIALENTKGSVKLSQWVDYEAPLARGFRHIPRSGQVYIKTSSQGGVYHSTDGYPENVWHKIKDFDEGLDDLVAPDLMATKQEMPTEAGPVSWICAVTDLRFILKFDGPNGFKFIN